MSAPPFRLDRAALRRSFNRASGSYDAAATLQRAVRAELLTRLQYFKLQPQRVLDLGAGTGEAAVALRRRFPGAAIVAVDVAHQMLLRARQRQWPWRRFHSLCADVRALPLPDDSVDLIFSNLMLQWCEDPLPALAEMQRVLKAGGLLLFSSFGPLTLQELRASWAAVDGHVHVSDFPGLPQLAAALSHAGFSEPVLDVETTLNHYASVHSLAGELRAIGAGNAAAQRPRGLTSRARLQRLIDAYEQRRQPGGLPATYEIAYGAAFASAGSGNRTTDSQLSAAGEVRIPLSALRTRGHR